MSPPFALMTAFIRLGILLIKFLQNSSSISRIQTNLIALIRAEMFEGCYIYMMQLHPEEQPINFLQDQSQDCSLATPGE